MQQHLLKGLHIQNYKSFLFGSLINLFKCNTVQEQIELNGPLTKRNVRPLEVLKYVFHLKLDVTGSIYRNLMLSLVSQQT
jgi:hypothetical protein